MPKTGPCPACGYDLSDPNHPGYTPDAPDWTIYDFVKVLQDDWGFSASSARDCCGVPTLAATLNQSAIPREHVHHVVAPRLLWDLYKHGMRKTVLRSLLLWVYVLSMTPLTRLEPGQWLEMFRHAGFTTFDENHVILNGLREAERPVEVPTLYRTASHAARNGMSWTSSRSHAELFGRRRQTLDRTGSEPVQLWKLSNLPPEAVLGVQHFQVGHSKGDGWAARGRADEWVIDPADLEPQLVPPPPCGCLSHWGDDGAAGLLVGRVKKGRVTHVLLQRRDEFSQEGRKWGIPGGALEPGEDDATAAVREAVEETGLDPNALDIVGKYRDEHGPDWAYTTVLAVTDRKLAVHADSPETDECQWVPIDDVTTLDLHPGFAGTWPKLRTKLNKKAVA